MAGSHLQSPRPGCPSSKKQAFGDEGIQRIYDHYDFFHYDVLGITDPK